MTVNAPLQDLQFINKIKKKSGMDTVSTDGGNPLEDLIIHLCIKDPMTCREVIEVRSNAHECSALSPYCRCSY